MGKIKFILNKKGVQQLLKSKEMEGICKEHATSIRERCGEDYEVSTYSGRNRVNASVSTKTARAYYSNLKHNTLLKAVNK